MTTLTWKHDLDMGEVNHHATDLGQRLFR